MEPIHFMEYSIPMALEDFLPVALSAFGFFLIAKTLAGKQASVGQLAWLGAALIVSGGFSKALWKLVIAASGSDLVVLREALFPLMGPGFVMMAWALWRGLKERKFTAAQIWAVPLALSALALASAGYLAMTQANRRWSLLLLVVTTLGNVLTSGQLIWNAWRRDARPAAALFLYNVLTIFLQARLARLEQTIALQWLEQLNNTLSWAAFALAVWLWRRNQQ
jgi:hypothetical protein